MDNSIQSSAGIFLSNVTGSNWNHTWYQNLPQCSAGTCIKLINISWLDLTFNSTGIGIPVSFFHRGGVDFKWNSPIQRCYTFNMYILSFRIFSRNWTISAGVNSWAGNFVGLLEWQESRLWWVFLRKIAESCARISSVLTFVLNIEYSIQKHSRSCGIWFELNPLCVIFYGSNVIHTLQLNFLFWFSL